MVYHSLNKGTQLERVPGRSPLKQVAIVYDKETKSWVLYKLKNHCRSFNGSGFINRLSRFGQVSYHSSIDLLLNADGVVGPFAEDLR